MLQGIKVKRGKGIKARDQGIKVKTYPLYSLIPLRFYASKSLSGDFLHFYLYTELRGG